MLLPEDFISETRRVMGDGRFERYLKAFDEEPPVSIRLNPLKTQGMTVAEGEPVAWCRHAYYLSRRPQFTFDPLLHAGCYYVQEAASMFLDTVLQQLLPARAVSMLDLCAAPGGKSTLARTALPAGSVLYANEPVRQRAHVLAENMAKWGWPDCHVSNSFPRDYSRSRMKFDVILCDVPCSGEGMFRKDPATIGEWSLQNVGRCQSVQREIVTDAWQCLNEGGLLIYSTCTLNTRENEENVRWMMEELGAKVLPVATRPEWNITGSLLEGFTEPVYRFIPGITRGEGLFICAMRKGEEGLETTGRQAPADGRRPSKGNGKGAVTTLELPALHVDGPCVEVSYGQAVSYLRHEALTLPADTPRGVVNICFQGHVLGTAKNIGNRANNLYPKEWKIKTTHIPNDYEAILRHT